MFLVIRWNGTREVGVNRDGSECSPRDAELLTETEATATALKYGGRVISESRFFGDA